MASPPIPVVVPKSIKEDAMVDRVERGTEVEKAEQGDGTRVCRLVDLAA